MNPMLKGKRANMGMTLFIGLILFNILMYVVIYSANADATVSDIGENSNLQYKINATTSENLKTTSVTHWYSGFNVGVFISDDAWWVSIFYVTLQGILLAVAIYAMIRGLS